jgi:signal recognition particle subunit SRP19
MLIHTQIEMRKQNKIFLWPVYFDDGTTRNNGRRVSKKLAVSSPKVDELQRAAKRLGMQPEVVSDAAHPSSPLRKTGLIILPKTDSKDKIVKKIAEELSSLRR